MTTTPRHPLNKRIPDTRRPADPFPPEAVNALDAIGRAIAAMITAEADAAARMAAAFRRAAAAFNKAHRRPLGGPDDYTLTR